MSLPPQIQDPTRSKHIFACVYGLSGIGKTRFIGETNLRTLIIRPPTDHTDSIREGNFKEWIVRDWSDMDEVQDYLQHGGGKDWDWVWLDTISLWQDHGLDHVWEDAVARKAERKQYDVDKGEFGINMNRLARWIRYTVGKDEFNFGVIAHAEPVEGLIPKGRTIIGPWVQGKGMSGKLCGYMNVVAYFEVAPDKEGEMRRVMRFDLTKDYYAKDQFDAFANGRLVDPTMDKFMARIKAARPVAGRTNSSAPITGGGGAKARAKAKAKRRVRAGR